MFSSQPRRDHGWWVVGAIWVLTLTSLLVQSIAPSWRDVLQGLPGEALWPLTLLALATSASTVGVLWASTHDTAMAHYAALDTMKRLQRLGLQAFLCLPTAGLVGLALLYPLFAATTNDRLTAPWLRGSANALLVYAVASLLLWERRRLLRFALATLLGGGLYGLGRWLSPGHPLSLSRLVGEWLRLFVLALLMVVLAGLGLRWLWQRQAYRRSLQDAAHSLLVCVGLGTVGLAVAPSTQRLQTVVSLGLSVGLVLGLTGLSAQALRQIHQLTRWPHALSRLHVRPYVFGATLPLALLVALGGWTQYEVTPVAMLVLMGSQLLGFVSFAMLASLHNVSLGQPHPVWVLLRPVLLFLLLTFPFGALGLTLLEIWR